VTEWTTLPIELIVEGRRALVIGASGECVPKIRRLIEAGASVSVVTANAPVDPEVTSLATTGAIDLCDRAFAPSDAANAVVIFVGTEHGELGASLASEARAERRLVSTLDRPEASTFINPAVARGNGVSIAISSGGRAPGLVRALRESIGRAISDATFGAFIREVGLRRAAEPRGKRSSAMRTLLEGFTVELRCTYPAWFRAPPLVPSGS
jgi:precorrin-2 dehydrogenase/sirohydrochlorin ferrochelatase